MIHPSTMAGTNWFTTGVGTTNPFQQSGSPIFRSTPFQGSGIGPGTNPFQSQQFGTQTAQIQNTINEVLRQAFPSILASLGSLPGYGFQNTLTSSGPFGQQGPFGFQTFTSPQGQLGVQTPFTTQGQMGFQTPIGVPGQLGLQTPIGVPGQLGLQTPMGLQGLLGIQNPFGSQMLAGPAQFQTGYWDQNPLQNPNTFWELVRQSTNLTLQSLNQQIPGLSQGLLGQGQTPLQNVVAQVCQTLAYACCYTVAATLLPLGQTQPQPNFLNYVAQVSQTVALACCHTVAATLISSNQAQAQGIPFNLNNAPQFTGIPGIPTGAGAF